MIKFLVKIFLFASVSFAFLMFFGNVFIYRDLGFIWVLGATLFEGLFYGVFMTLTLGLMHSIKVDGIKEKGDIDPYNVNQTDSVEINSSIEATFKKAEKVLSDLKFAIKDADEQNYKIYASNGINWLTWGEKVCLSFEDLSNNKTRVLINSKPSLKTTIADYGKNLSNVKTIKKSLINL